MEVIRGLAIFCEDIREEKSGQDTLIGIMADNLAVPLTPVLVAKLALYVRLYFDCSAQPEAVNAALQMPSGEMHELGGASIDLVRESFLTARSKNSQLAGIILKGVFSPLPIPRDGAMNAIVTIAGVQRALGTLNVVIDPAANASEPPS